MSNVQMVSVKKNEWELSKNLIDFKENQKIATMQKKIKPLNNIDYLKDSNLPNDQTKEEEKDADVYNPKAILQKHISKNRPVVDSPLPEIVEEEKEAQKSESSKDSIDNSQKRKSDSSSADAGSDGKIKEDQLDKNKKKKMLYY